MKSTGIVRRLDGLGRIVLPSELRQGLDLKQGDRVKITREGRRVIVRRYDRTCLLCGSSKAETQLTEFCGKLVCAECIHELKALDCNDN